MTRAHVRLLGPCFKTGQADHACFRLRYWVVPETSLTDSSYRQHATVTRPHTISNPLVKLTDRVKRLLECSTTAKVVSNQVSNHKGFAGSQHLNYHISRTQPDDRNKCGASPVEQATLVSSPRKDNKTSTTSHRHWAWMFPANTCKFCPLTPERFHVLFNSLFKVLFNFPSRYLFAIGLVVIFSLRWSLPPDLGCTPKQPDSTDETHCTIKSSYGPSTLHGLWPRSRGT